MKLLNPITIAWKLKRKSEKLSLYLFHKAQAQAKPTYSDKDWKHWNKLRLSSPLICPGSYDKAISWAEEVLKHTFDLLGSGKVKVHYGLDAKGFEGYKYPPLKVDFQFDDKGKWLARFINKANLSYSQKVWRFLRSINPSYEPIDWQLDFKSGYRWDNDTFYMDIRYGHKLGADVKVPWELSRFQHLSALAITYKITGDEKYALEYVSQILDWIAANPPMFGVNWKCTMDVAIRVANWIFWFGCIKDWVDRQEWKDEFYRIFLNSLYDHLRFIPRNLEWSPTLTTNHYLSDIAGLLILASSTEEIFPESKKLRRFAIEELKKEMFKQVYPDGTDFEASTCYHRLVLEIFFYPVWWEIVHHMRFNGKNYKKVSEEIFGKTFVNRLYKMFDAVLYLLKPNGRMPQIGDNDNGQFIKLYPREVLDMRYLLALGAVFFKESKFKVRELFQSDEDTVEIRILYSEKEIWDRLSWNELANIKSKAFTNSGWYVMRNNKNYMIISCGPNSHGGLGGHAHNDKLSFEICVEGKDIIVDPGTYVYTANEKIRNIFRSTKYHNTIVGDSQEQSRFDENKLFSIGFDATVRVNKWQVAKEYDFFDGEHSGYERLKNPLTHRRQILFDKREGYWLVKDILTGKGMHRFDLYFHFAPMEIGILSHPKESKELLGMVKNIRNPLVKKDFNVDESLVIETRIPEEANLLIIPANSWNMSLEITRGWVSGNYGTKEAAFVVEYTKVDECPVELITLLLPIIV
ncbi:MAG: hypothetical protein DRG83_00550 [Deltaproteobacteria bacterium]|nr:MAG: hypothetical protein DRG83_00550 [Deltaproteobacteria bacterium]